MAKTLKQILDGVKSSKIEKLSLGTKPGVDYSPKSEAEINLVKTHSVEKHANRQGNTDKLYQAAEIKPSMDDPKMKNFGYKNGEDEKVYEEKENVQESISHRLKMEADLAKSEGDMINHHRLMKQHHEVKAEAMHFNAGNARSLRDSLKFKKEAKKHDEAYHKHHTALMDLMYPALKEEVEVTEKLQTTPIDPLVTVHDHRPGNKHSLVGHMNLSTAASIHNFDHGHALKALHDAGNKVGHKVATTSGVHVAYSKHIDPLVTVHDHRPGNKHSLVGHMNLSTAASIHNFDHGHALKALHDAGNKVGHKVATTSGVHVAYSKHHVTEETETETEVTEKSVCNHSPKGQNCPVHGMANCENIKSIKEISKNAIKEHVSVNELLVQTYVNGKKDRRAEVHKTGDKFEVRKFDKALGGKKIGSHTTDMSYHAHDSAKKHVNEEAELLEGQLIARKTVMNQRGGEDQYELHHHGSGKTAWHSIIKTHQDGQSTMNSSGGHSPVHVGSEKYVKRHWDKIKSQKVLPAGHPFRLKEEILDEKKKETVLVTMKSGNKHEKDGGGVKRIPKADYDPKIHNLAEKAPWPIQKQRKAVIKKKLSDFRKSYESGIKPAEIASTTAASNIDVNTGNNP